MYRIIFTIGLAIGAIASPCMSGEDEVAVEYDYAGLVRIEIGTDERDPYGGRERDVYELDYVWHTTRRDVGFPVIQSLESFDRHEAHIALAKEEIETVRKWIVDHRIFDFPDTFERVEERYMANLYRSSLHVVVGSEEHSVLWTGASILPQDLKDAVEGLRSICDTIRRDRTDRAAPATPEG